MGRSCSPFHVITVLLAVVLGWPWHIALAAAESSPAPVPSKQSSWVARAGQRGRQVGRSGKWGQTACPAVAPDYDEDDSEEGDDGGVFHPWSLFTTAAALPGPVVLPGCGALDPIPRPTLRLHELCRLRC